MHMHCNACWVMWHFWGEWSIIYQIYTRHLALTTKVNHVISSREPHLVKGSSVEKTNLVLGSECLSPPLLVWDDTSALHQLLGCSVFAILHCLPVLWTVSLTFSKFLFFLGSSAIWEPLLTNVIQMGTHKKCTHKSHLLLSCMNRPLELLMIVGGHLME